MELSGGYVVDTSKPVGEVVEKVLSKIRETE